MKSSTTDEEDGRGGQGREGEGREGEEGEEGEGRVEMRNDKFSHEHLQNCEISLSFPV